MIDKNITKSSKTLFETVVAGGYCIGCGTCAVISNSAVKIEFNKYLMLQALPNGHISQDQDEKMQRVCPFSEKSIDENVIGEGLYGHSGFYNGKIGYYHALYAGFVASKGYREQGSSGGMGTWILSTLMERGLVDRVIHIKYRESTDLAGNKRIYSYQLSNTVEEVRSGAKTKYYPIELSEVLTLIINQPGNYALIGVPCFIKAVRLLMREEPVFQDRIKFCIGLVCGHLKSANFGRLLGWQLGIKPSNLNFIDFRTKLSDYDANKYGVTVIGEDRGIERKIISGPVNQLYGTNWGLGFFKYKACDFCDDVFAETADITLGDAWIPKYENDPAGTNIIVVRDPRIDEIIKDSISLGELMLEPLSEEEIIQSQASGLFHRREGLSYRLSLISAQNHWYPPKRVKILSNMSSRIRQRQDLRIQMAEKSHIAFNEAVDCNDLQMFKDSMIDLESRYKALYKRPILIRILSRLKHLFIK